ncbi:MAG: vitamin K epoxide reductase family protein [Candidatus Poseidoniaceae archaeon]|nr:vitamin K epoxide reductase family protein [Candidatus Poseidoniaceae archaeon]
MSGLLWMTSYRQEANNMAISADTQLLFHWIPILLGLTLMSPWGESLGRSISAKWPSMETKRGRTIGGMLLAMFGGFTVSAHTYWIHNKAKEIGSGDFCAGGGIWDCSSVIGNDEWNTMPFVDIPWGLAGMLAFCVFLWLTISISKGLAETWVSAYIRYGLALGGAGILIVMYLIYAEIEIGKLCQYCSTAHVSHLIATYGFFSLSKMHGTSEWGVGMMDDARAARKERRKTRGYIAPTIKDDSEE